MGRAYRLLPLAILTFACGGNLPPKPSVPAASPGSRIAIDGRPSVAVLARAGDPAPAVAMVTVTEGLDEAAGDAPAVALAALLEARLAGAARVTVGPGTVRVSALADSVEGAEAVGAKLAGALVTAYPGPSDGEAVEKKLRALSALAPAKGALALCEGRLRSSQLGTTVTTADVERYRAAAASRLRTGFAGVGPRAIAEGIGRALARGPAWPLGTAPKSPPLPAAAELFDATAALPPGRATVTVAAWGPGDRASGRAGALQGRAAPLAARLAAGDPSATYAVHVARLGDQACTTIELHAAASYLFGTTAIAEDELSREDGAPSPTPEPDPRDAAERAAESEITVVPAEGAPGVRVGVAGDPRAKTDVLAAYATFDQSLGEATRRLAQPVLEVRHALEPGQAELVVVLASPCGTSGETQTDAGASALAITASAFASNEVALEPFIAADGVGVVARASARPGEPPAALGRRVASAIAPHLFALGELDVARARSQLADGASTSALHLATTLLPTHPSWVLPLGSPAALLHVSDGLVAARLDALRRGPLRAALLVDGTDADAAAIERELDRWAPRSAGARATCVEPEPPPPPKPGSYFAAGAPGAPAEAWIAHPVPRESLAAATALADWLDGRALGPALTGLVRDRSARIVGAPRAPFLVVRVETANGALDGAVAQTRALLERVRHLSDSDATGAVTESADRNRRALLDPRQRAIVLFRGAPKPATGDDVRAFAATLHDDALVIAAVRPPSAPPAPKPGGKP